RRRREVRRVRSGDVDDVDIRVFRERRPGAVGAGDAVGLRERLGAELRARADGGYLGVRQQLQVLGEPRGDPAGSEDSPADGLQVTSRVEWLLSGAGRACHAARFRSNAVSTALARIARRRTDGTRISSERGRVPARGRAHALRATPRWARRNPY